jgi:hypothetical protein
VDGLSVRGINLVDRVSLLCSSWDSLGLFGITELLS